MEQERVAILGMGLMGGSIGLALRRRGFRGVVAGYARRAEVRELALNAGMVHEAFANPAEAARGADLTVLCLPILTNAAVLEQCRDAFPAGSLVTDVGSTKAELVRTLVPILKGTGAEFVGSHPIAGSEQQGAASARADLYEGAVVVVTPGPEASRSATDRVGDFWRSLGARVHLLDAEQHDALLGRTSHLPHLAASALAAVVGRGDDPGRTGFFCGPGFVDSTRVAEGSPAVWLDIIRTNRHNVVAELEAMGEALREYRDAVAAGDDDRVLELLQRGKDCRQRLMGARNGAGA